MKILRSAALVPTFRSSCSIAAPTLTNFGKSWALANSSIPVPLTDLMSPKGTRRLRCRDFRSAVLAAALCVSLAAAASAQTTLRIGLAEDPDVLDPSIGRTYVGRIVFASLCDKLFDIDEKLNIVPQLAKLRNFRRRQGNDHQIAARRQVSRRGAV